MKLTHAVLALALVSLAACSGSNGRGRTVELPGGGPTAAEAQAADAQTQNWFERMFGMDDRPNAGPCPLMGVLAESSRLVQFQEPGVERYANIAFTGEVRGVRGLCRYIDADPINVAMQVDFAFGRGPAAASETKTYRYWVAVARRGRAPIEKSYFDLEVEFREGEPVVTRTEEIERIIIPRANADTSGENFEILVGLDLTPEQLQFNRDGKRFRVDAATRS